MNVYNFSVFCEENYKIFLNNKQINWANAVFSAIKNNEKTITLTTNRQEGITTFLKLFMAYICLLNEKTAICFVGLNSTMVNLVKSDLDARFNVDNNQISYTSYNQLDHFRGTIFDFVCFDNFYEISDKKQEEILKVVSPYNSFIIFTS